MFTRSGVHLLKQRTMRSVFHTHRVLNAFTHRQQQQLVSHGMQRRYFSSNIRLRDSGVHDIESFRVEDVNDESKVLNTIHAIREWKKVYATSKDYDQNVLENALLKTLQIIRLINNPDDRCLMTYSAFDETVKQIFKNNVKRADLSIIRNHHFTPEDVVAVFFNNVEVYEQVIEIYATCGYPEQVFELMEAMLAQSNIQTRMEQLINPVERPIISDTFTELNNEDVIDPTMEDAVNSQKLQLEKLLSSDNSDLSLPVFQRLKTYEYLIQSCAEMGKIKQVIEIYQFMKKHNIQPDSQIYNRLIAAFIPQGNIAGALHFLEQMALEGIEPSSDICASLMESFLSANDSRYQSVFNGFMNAGVELNERLFKSYVACVCLISKDPNQAIAFVSEHSSRTDLNIDISIYNLILESCVESDSLLVGLELYGQLINGAKTIPTIQTFNLVLKLFAKQGDKRTTILWDKMKEEHERGTSAYVNFVPNTDTFNALILMHVVNHDLQSAREVLKTMHSLKIEANIVSHNLMIGELNAHYWQPQMQKELSKDRGIFHQYMKSHNVKREESITLDPFDFLTEEDPTKDATISVDELVDRTVEIAHDEEEHHKHGDDLSKYY